MARTRDDFSAATKKQIGKSAGWLCSYPGCRALTVSATADGTGTINLGTAAHICAAAPGGPRYDHNMSTEERSSASNGIWMCRNHGTAVDIDPNQFPVALLRQWKEEASRDSWRRVLGGKPPPNAGISENLHADRLRDAAAQDLAALRNMPRWPLSIVPLTLKVEGLEDVATTTALAVAARTLDDLILVAGPGVGKTTTLLQIAEGAVATGAAIPIFVNLGDWATESRTLLESILARAAFAGISALEFRCAAASGNAILLLDGWNEIDGGARSAARTEIERMKAEMPELGLIVSTRQQALDVPFRGKRIELLALNEDQQLEIAKSVVGENAVALLDHAWRTAGVRDLVPIPLYLNALLALPTGPFPETREEVLSRFVEAHHADPAHDEQLRPVARGFQQDYLRELAVAAMQAANTAISDSDARRAIAKTSASLIHAGQIAVPPEPAVLLDRLVAAHVLVRAGDGPGVAFQHQQFQEWFASHEVERRAVLAASDAAHRRELQLTMLDDQGWEEAILFAVERMARGPQDVRRAGAQAIIAAFEVEPILAAEMIYRATDAVWQDVESYIIDSVERWHVKGKNDRAMRFMLNSGRPEFIEWIWPLISNENDQISLAALRNCRRFRPSVLGDDPGARIAALGSRPREVLLSEMIFHGGIEGIELAASVARGEKDLSILSSVANALAFRMADRHLVYLLQEAPDAVLDSFVQQGHDFCEIAEGALRSRLDAARLRNDEAMPLARLRRLAFSPYDPQSEAAVTVLVAQAEVESRQDAATAMIYRLAENYPAAVSAGLLQRLREGRSLFLGAHELLSATEAILEDEELLSIALKGADLDDRADAAAAVLGPIGVGCLVDALLEADALCANYAHPDAKSAGDRRKALQSRIDRSPALSLLEAVLARAGASDPLTSALLAQLLMHRFRESDARVQAFGEDALDVIRELAESWAERMVDVGDAPRSALASVATLIACVPDVRLLDVLERMLDHDLERYQAARLEAEASQWQPGPDTNEARLSQSHAYMQAFRAIDAPETRLRLERYLSHPLFGELAAQIIVDQCIARNDTRPDRRFRAGPDFTEVAKWRAAWLANLSSSSAETDPIFAVAEALLADGKGYEERQLGARLAQVAARLPHGNRDELFAKALGVVPRSARLRLMTNRVLSGEVIPTGIVAEGVRAILDAVALEPWILMENNNWEFKGWLQLLPFTEEPSRIADVLSAIPLQHRRAHHLEGLVTACAASPSPGAGAALFDVAAFEPALYKNYAWRTAVVGLAETDANACLQLVALIASGKLASEGHGDWRWARDLGTLMRIHGVVRAEVYAILRATAQASGILILASAVSEGPDEEGLILLTELEEKLRRPLLGQRAVQSVVTASAPSPNMQGAHEVIPVAATSLRKRLLALTRDGAPDDRAARTLRLIDSIRDEYGPAQSEPRHPDFVSGNAWPILMPQVIGSRAASYFEADDLD